MLTLLRILLIYYAAILYGRAGNGSMGHGSVGQMGHMGHGSVHVDNNISLIIRLTQ